MATTKDVRYADHEKHFRTHFNDTFGSGGGKYNRYEPAYRSGLRYGTSSEHAGRSFSDLEPDMRRSYEKEHGEGTWSKVKRAARHAFERGRSHGTTKGTSSSGSPSLSGSSQTASGDPGSAMREGGFDAHRDSYREHHTETYGDSSHDFAHHEAAYRHGHEYGHKEKYAGRSFEDLKSDMRSSYEKKHGEGTWSKVKGAVRHAFKRSRAHSSSGSKTTRKTA